MQNEKLSPSEAATYLLDECRMVLPGIQALFGFQLIAVFNDRFKNLMKAEQIIHFVALFLVAISVGLVMAPAAYHRQKGIHHVDDEFLQNATRLLIISMVPLMCGISLDLYLIGYLIFDHVITAVLLAGILFLIFTSLWFVLPRALSKQRRP